MKPELTPLEARVIGCLIEKGITTPDNYPLTLNALTHAVNQKSNRDPVLDLSDSEVQSVVDGLMKKHLVTDRSGGMGGRVTRYRHRFCNTQFGELTLSAEELAIVCELLIRGPQTPGELRSRAKRMAPLSDVSVVDQALSDLAGRDDPIVRQLAREPGRREARWMHLFGVDASGADAISSRADSGASGVAAPEAQTPSPAPTTVPVSQADPVEALRTDVASLRREIDELRRRLDVLES